MKYSLLILSGYLALNSVLDGAAQTPNWQRAVVAESPFSAFSTPIVIRAVATDAAGNVYITGDGDGTYTLGGLTSAGSYPGTHMFVAKWSPSSGSFSWIKNGHGTYPGPTTGTAPNCSAKAIAVSGSSVYVTGNFIADGMYFDGSTTGLQNQDAGSNYTSQGDVYVAKFNDNGSTADFVWAQGVGSRFDDRALALVAEGTNVYLAVSAFGPTTSFGSSLTLNGGGTYVAKFQDGGNTGSFLWAQPVPGTVNGLAAVGNSVMLGGEFSTATAAFGATTLTTAGGSDGFVAKLTDAGASSTFAWARSAGGAANDRVTAVAANGAGVYATGTFASTAASFGNISLSASGGTDVFIAKMNDAGFVWAQQAGGTGNEAATGIAADGTGIYVCGSLTGAAATFGSTVLTNAGGTDVFLARLTDSGNSTGFDWAKRGGGTGNDAASAVATRGGKVYVGGVVVAPASFDNVTIATSRYLGAGLLASLTETVGLATTAPTWAAELRVAPNPARAAVNVHMPAVAGATQSILTLFDAQGRIVRTRVLPLPVGGLTTELPLTGLAPGLYHLQLQAGGQQVSKALAIE